MLSSAFHPLRVSGFAAVLLFAVTPCLPVLAQDAQPIPAPMLEPAPAPAEPSQGSAPQVSVPTEPTAPATAAPGAVAPATPQVQPTAPAPATTVPAAAAPAEAEAKPAGTLHDLSPWGMFQAAHWVVKGVMISLAFASAVTWTVMVFKAVEIAIARLRANRSGRIIRDAASLTAASKSLGHRRDPAAFMAQAVLAEYNRSDPALDLAGGDGVKERARSILDRVDAQAGSRMRRGTGVLATIGSTAPFVGLFGTVWGIMNSFIGIAESQTTNLAVVAPGIAEALLATAMGLVAAIPAVVIYNHFTRSISGYRQVLADASAGIERLLSRDLDFRKVAAPEV